MPGVVGVMQVKVWLLGISPMVWRCVLVRDTCSLRELHGVIQVAMGWEYPTGPLVSYRKLSVWNLSPLVVRAFGAH